MSMRMPVRDIENQPQRCSNDHMRLNFFSFFFYISRFFLCFNFRVFFVFFLYFEIFCFFFDFSRFFLEKFWIFFVKKYFLKTYFLLEKKIWTKKIGSEKKSRHFFLNFFADSEKSIPSFSATLELQRMPLELVITPAPFFPQNWTKMLPT